VSQSVNITKGPLRRNYQPYRGDTFDDIKFSILINGAPADLSGDTFVMRIVNAATLQTVHELTIGDGITVTDNSVFCVLTATQTADLPLVKHKYDVQWTKSNGTVKTIQVGFLEPEADV